MHTGGRKGETGETGMELIWPDDQKTRVTKMEEARQREGIGPAVRGQRRPKEESGWKEH